MATPQQASKTESSSIPRTGNLAGTLGIFVLALIPRAIALQHFVTADEAKWVYRSAQFLAALLRGDFAATAVNLTPAVTTTWLGSLGLRVYYQLHQAELGLPFIAWLEALPEFRVELPVLAAVRWPVVLFASLSIVVIYALTKRLWGGPVALLGAILLALDPHTLALTRIIGHDSVVSLFLTLSLLMLLLAAKDSQLARPFHQGWLAISGLMAGLAFLSKSPAFFLVVFAALFVFVKVRQAAPTPTGFVVLGRQWLQAMAIWGVTSYLIFFAFWPAVWAAPISQPFAVIENAFFSATSLDEPLADREADEEAGTAFQQVPDWGPLYYVVNGLFKLSPLVSLGLILGLWTFIRQKQKGSWADWLAHDQFWLLLFALLFLIFMTLGGKRSNRYILPIFPALIFVAAFAWQRVGRPFWVNFAARRIPQLTENLGAARSFIALFVLLGLLTLLPYAPYYFSYFNPLFGGPLTAPRLVNIGWGEGLDQVGGWLDQQPDALSDRAGSRYASTVAPFYRGDLADLSSDRLDYVVFYLKDWQAGFPRPEIVQYFQTQPTLYSTHLAGIQYAQIYAGPTAFPLSAPEADPALVAYRPYRNYAPIGEDLIIDLIWSETIAQVPAQTTVTLVQDDQVLAAAESVVKSVSGAARVSQVRLPIPPDLAAGQTYELLADDQHLGTIGARNFQAPPNLAASEFDYGQQVKLLGFMPDWAFDRELFRIDLVFQAAPKAWADYTVYVHLIDAQGEWLAGFDTQPQPPTSQWAKGEINRQTFPISLPPDLSAEEIYRVRVGWYHAQTGEALGEGYVLPIEVQLPAE